MLSHLAWAATIQLPSVGEGAEILKKKNLDEIFVT